ncbi:serine/threonine-protein kinase [Gordonia sp. NPDC003429]
MLQPGAVFAGYTIDRLLGAGGMGEVYVARHPRLPRSDALKVLNPRYAADPAFRRRFEREADTVATLNHPNIVAVHDRGDTDGHLWIALQLIDGTDVDHILRTHGPLPAHETARITADVAAALDHAADNGLVHRDVKPANILISRTDHVLLTDFGIARTGTDNTQLTATGTTIGTLDYASPEQLRGLALDGRSDQYSLACTAYHLLTGHPPHTDTNAATVIAKHLETPLPSLRTDRPDLSPIVDDVLATATDKNPADRYPTATAFAQALRTALTTPAPAADTSATVARTTAAQPRHQPQPPPHPVPPNPHYAPTVAGRATPPPAHQPPPGSAPRPPFAGPQPPVQKSHKKWWLVGGAAALVVIIAAATGVYFVVRPHKAPPDPAIPVAEATTLERTAATPLSASLEHKPDKSLWTYTPPPGSPSSGFAGGSAKYVLNWRLSPAPQQAELLDIVDADSGKLARSVDLTGTGGYGAPECAIDVPGTHAACPGTSAVVFVDLDRGAVTGRLTDAHDPVPADNGFVLTATTNPAPPSSTLEDIVSVDAAGRQRWRASTSATPTPVSGGGVVTITTSRDESDPFSKDRTDWRRVSDGKVLHTIDAGPDAVPPWAPYVGGFMVPGAGHAEFYDLNGTRTAVSPNGWTSSQVGVAGGGILRGTDTPWLTSLPVVVRKGSFDALGVGTADFGVVNPATGHILWQGLVNGGLPPSVTGTGTAFMVSNTFATESHAQAFGDSYAGSVSPHGSVPSEPRVFASDGTRALIGSTFGEDGDLLALAPGNGDILWRWQTNGTVESYGGKVYVGLHRII